MEVGEKAVFTIPAELAVTKSGSPASIPWNIPPNQELRFDIELISLTTDVLNDKGILKKITKFGTGNKHPCDLDEVFDGFGEQGRPSTGNEAAVPPGATLHVNLQLVTWKKVRYIGESQEILMKTPHEEGDYKLSVATYKGAVVRVNLIGKLQDGTVFHRSGEQPFEFTIGQENVIQGLQEAVLAMETKVASVVIPPQHAFGTVGSNEYELAVVPPNSVVIYDIELLSVDGEPCFLIMQFYAPSPPVRRLKHGHKPREATLFVPLPPAARPPSLPRSAGGKSQATATSATVGSSSATTAEENQSSETAQEERGHNQAPPNA